MDIDVRGTYRNNKNQKLYEVLHVAVHSESGDLMVVYKAPDNQIWVRPLELFKEKFTPVPKASV